MTATVGEGQESDQPRMLQANKNIENPVNPVSPTNGRAAASAGTMPALALTMIVDDVELCDICGQRLILGEHGRCDVCRGVR
jgi:hypothetical protein